MTADLERVSHMVTCATDIQEFLKGRRHELATNEMLRAAILRKFEVMGEAAKHVGHGFRDAHPDIPWKRIIAFRNVLIHAYDNLDASHLEAAIEALPKLLKDLKRATDGR